MASIHGQGIAKGNGLAPVCTDCHGIHTIKSHANPNSPAAEQNVSRDICARCHEGVRLSQEFGLPGNRVNSLLRQLSRACRAGRIGGGSELLKLSRGAQHSAVERSAFDDQ